MNHFSKRDGLIDDNQPGLLLSHTGLVLSG